MLTKCLVPATTRSRSLYSSCSTVGLRTNSPLIRPTRTWAVGVMNGMSLMAMAALAAMPARMSGSFCAVEGQDVQVNLHLVHEPLGEQRPQRAVDQAGGEDFLGGRAAFALHEPAGELAGGGAALAVVDLEREEVDPLARVGADDGAEDDGVAVLNGDGPVGQLGQRAGLDRERAPADLAFNLNGLHQNNVLRRPPRWEEWIRATDGQSRAREEISNSGLLILDWNAGGNPSRSRLFSIQFTFRIQNLPVHARVCASVAARRCSSPVARPEAVGRAGGETQTIYLQEYCTTRQSRTVREPEAKRAGPNGPARFAPVTFAGRAAR